MPKRKLKVRNSNTKKLNNNLKKSLLKIHWNKASLDTLTSCCIQKQVMEKMARLSYSRVNHTNSKIIMKATGNKLKNGQRIHLMSLLKNLVNKINILDSRLLILDVVKVNSNWLYKKLVINQKIFGVSTQEKLMTMLPNAIFQMFL